MVVDLLSLLAVLTLGVLSPGPDFLLVLKNSVSGSRSRAFATVAGIAGGLLLQLTAIALGFTVVTPALLRVIQLGGAVFLAWVGARALFPARDATLASKVGAPAGSDVGAPFLAGLACNLTNPKAFLFYVSLFAQLLKPAVSPLWRIALPALLVAHATIVWGLVVLALQAPPFARRLTRAQRWLPRVFGVALLVLAVWVAWQAW
jgi:threonine/homoserine/homoserine lactone efflux protein